MKRHVLITAMLISIMSLLVGGTVAAYFSDNLHLQPTEFSFATVDIEVQKVSHDGGPGITVAKDTGEAKWTIKNTGNSDVYLRAKIIERYDDRLDSVIDRDNAFVRYKKDKPRTTEHRISDGQWRAREDGYFYYKRPVYRDETVDFDLTFRVEGSWWGNGELRLQVEAIQVANINKDSEWPYF